MAPAREPALGRLLVFFEFMGPGAKTPARSPKGGAQPNRVQGGAFPPQEGGEMLLRISLDPGVLVFQYTHLYGETAVFPYYGIGTPVFEVFQCDEK